MITGDSNRLKAAIVLLTYQRTEYAVRTIEALEKNLAPTVDWQWIICDDGSDPAHVARLANTVTYGHGNDNLLAVHSQRSSYGAIANAGLSRAWEAGYDVTLMLEDDWECQPGLDIHRHLDVVTYDDRIGAIRMGYMSTGAQGTLEIMQHRPGAYWVLDDADTRLTSLFAWAGHPALVHRRYFAVHGMYPERWQPGETEIKMCWQYGNFAPYIVWPAEFGVVGPWAHIGTVKSYVWNGGEGL